MPEYLITDPASGRKVKLTGDSPPTDAEMEEIFAGLPQDKPQVQGRFAEGTPYLERVKRSFLGTPEVGLAYGAAKPLIGAFQLGAMAGEIATGQEGANTVSSRIASGLQNFEKARERAGGDQASYMAGQVISGGALTSKIAPAAGWIMRALQSAGIGGAIGAVEPVTNPDQSMGGQKASQIATGAAVGGVTSLAGTALRTAYERIFRGGQEIVAGRAANTAAGDRQPAVVAALRANQNPLSQGTAGQVAAPAGSAEFSALQRQASNVRPSEYEAIRRGQDAARLNAVQSVGRTPDALRAATTARSAAAGPLYRAAEASQNLADPRRTINLIDRVSDKHSREAAFAPLQQVRESLFEAYPAQQRARDSWNSIRATVDSMGGKAPKELVSARQILNRVKNFDIDEYRAIAQLQALKPKDAAARSAISDAIKNMEIPNKVATESVPNLISASRNIARMINEKGPTGAPINSAIVRELSTIKRSLDSQIVKAAPEYRQANQIFADLSKPIDRMKVGQYIEEKLVPSLNDAGANAPQRAQVFASAMRDMNDSVAKATGFKRGGDIASLLTPDEMSSLRAVGADLGRDADFERLARAGGRRANDVVRDMFAGTGINPLSRTMMVINAILRRTGANASERTLDILAQKMQDPAAMAAIMGKATVAERKEIERGILLYLTSETADNADDAASWAQRVSERGLNSVMGGDQ